MITALDDIEIRMYSPMVMYKENVTYDMPRLVAALRAVLAECDRADAKPGPDGECKVHTAVIRQAVSALNRDI